MQLKSGCIPPSCRKLAAEVRLRHAASITGSLMPSAAATFGSKSVRAGVAGASLWHVAQSIGAGFKSVLSCEWQVKQDVCPSGMVLNVPFFNQKASPRVFGGVVTYSCSDVPCGM